MDGQAVGKVVIVSPFDTPPDFVNELGVKWWRDQHTTDYARRKDAYGVSLEAVGYYIELPEGGRTRLVLSKHGEVLAEGQSLDAVGTKIDLLKFAMRPDTSTVRIGQQPVTHEEE
jgi:hypothetical protein